MCCLFFTTHNLYYLRGPFFFFHQEKLNYSIENDMTSSLLVDIGYHDVEALMAMDMCGAYPVQYIVIIMTSLPCRINFLSIICFYSNQDGLWSSLPIFVAFCG